MLKKQIQKIYKPIKWARIFKWKDVVNSTIGLINRFLM